MKHDQGAPVPHFECLSHFTLPRGRQLGVGAALVNTTHGFP
jgi:hypothetical protein